MPTVQTAANAQARPLTALLPGLLLVALLAIPAAFLGKAFPLLGGAVIGMLIGILCRQFLTPGERTKPGVQFASKQLLQYSIVGLGFSLPLRQVATTGLQSLPVTLVTLSVAFVVALIAGRALGIPGKLKVLIGAGTAICGGSAIAAITPVLKQEDHDTAYALSTIVLFNIVAVMLFPAIGKMLGMTDAGFGMWAGTAINDTSSVVAAAYAWNNAAGEYATIVKLTRAMMIVPVTLAVGLIYQRHQQGASLRRAVPWFIILFVVASAINEWLPATFTHVIRQAAPVMIVGALTAIGLSTDVGRMRRAGWRPLLLGLLVWISVALSSLLMQRVTGLL